MKGSEPKYCSACISTSPGSPAVHAWRKSAEEHSASSFVLILSTTMTSDPSFRMEVCPREVVAGKVQCFL